MYGIKKKTLHDSNTPVRVTAEDANHYAINPMELKVLIYALFKVVFVKCVCIWNTSVFFQFYGVLSGVIYNYSPPLFLLLFSHTFAAENCAIGNIVK